MLRETDHEVINCRVYDETELKVIFPPATYIIKAGTENKVVFRSESFAQSTTYSERFLCVEKRPQVRFPESALWREL